MDIKIKPVTDAENLNKVIEFNKMLDEAMTPFLPEILISSKSASDNPDDPYWQTILAGEKAFSALAEADGKAVGMVVIKFGGEFSHLESLFVLSEYRGLGLGGVLVNFAKEEAKKRGAKVMFLNVLLGNDGAKKLYRKADFSDFRTTMITKL